MGRVSRQDEGEERLPCGTMHLNIVRVAKRLDKLVPVVMMISYLVPQKSHQNPVVFFSLSFCLRVVACRRNVRSPEDHAYNIEKVRHEVRSVVSEKVIKNSVRKDPMGQKTVRNLRIRSGGKGNRAAQLLVSVCFY